MDNVVLLQKVSIFAGLPPGDLADLAARMRPRAAAAGSLIVSHEEPGDALFVIVQGKVKVVLYGDRGREIILSILHEGDFFGEMSLLDRQPRSANVVAQVASSLSGSIGRPSRTTSRRTRRPRWRCSRRCRAASAGPTP